MSLPYLCYLSAAFDRCQLIMDTLKITAFFWNKETPTDGSTRWADSRVSDVVAPRWQR